MRTSYGDIGAISSVFKGLDVLCLKGDYFCGLICNRLVYYRDSFSQRIADVVSCLVWEFIISLIIYFISYTNIY